MTPAQYAVEIVMPTVRDFMKAHGDRRPAFPAHRGLSRWRVLLAYRMNDPCGGPRATLVGSHGVCRISRKAPAAFRYIRLPSPAGRRSKLYLICFLCRSSN